VEEKRSVSICRLRPDVVLHGEPYPDDKEIMEAVEDDLRACPGLVLGHRVRRPFLIAFS